MPNQFDSIAQGAAILKNWYEGPIVTQFNDSCPFYREIQKGTEQFAGSKVIRPLKVLRNPGIGAVAEGGNLPQIGRQTTVQAEIQAKYNYLRPGITAQMMTASQGDKAAFISAMQYEMEQGLEDMITNFNRQLFWDGSGKIATVSANAVSSNVIVCTGRTADEDANKYLQPGLNIDIYTALGVLVAQSINIVSMTGTSTVTLTLASAVTVSATDIVVLSGSYGQEVQGLLTSLDGLTTTIYAVDRSAYPVYQGNSINAAGGQLTLNLMQQAYNEAKRRGGASIGVVFTDFNSERFYNKLLVADKRYVGKVAGDGTFSKKEGSYLEFGEAKVVPDKDCTQAIYFLDPKTWKKYVLGKELAWADETGSQLIAQVSADSFELRLRLWANLFPEKPSANARLHNYISP